MTIQYSAAVLNAKLDVLETVTGASAKLRIYSGSVPANCAAAATGTLLVEIALPADWMSAASGNAKTKSGTWTGTGAAAGTAGYFRVVDNAGTTTHAQGTAGASGTDMILDNAVIAVSQNITVNTFTVNGPSANA